MCTPRTAVSKLNHTSLHTRVQLLILQSARSESGDRLELQRVELFHLRLLLNTHTTRVRVQLKTEGEKSDACGVQPFLQLSRRSGHQRERSSFPWHPR